MWPFSETKVIFNEMFGSQGLYIVDFTPPERIDIDVYTTTGSDFGYDVSGLDPFATVWLAASNDTSMPFGTGPFLGLGGDALQFIQLPFEPFVAQADANGEYSFYFPGPLPPGSTDLVAVSFKASAGTFMLSNLASITL